MNKIFFYLMMAAVLAKTLACADRCLAQGPEYQIGVDDIVEINVLQPEKINVATTVSPDGSITFPYIGNVEVAGLNLSEVKKEIESKLSDGYMKYPLITVVLKESRSKKFYIYGDVVKPGMYTMGFAPSVLKAISIAGGFSKNSLSTQVKILRPKPDGNGQDVIRVDMKKVMMGSTDADLMLQPQDTIIVSEEKFFVSGDVVKPGVYPIEGDTTVLKAISMAGGFSKNSLSIRVKILRPKAQGSGQDIIKVDIKKVIRGISDADIILSPNDTIIVSEEKFFISGDVVKPGEYPMEENTTVLRAISIAGGFIKSGSVTQVKILRPSSETSGNEAIDVDIKTAMKGSYAADVMLSPADTVMVTQSKFYVYGEVNKPGVYPLEEDATVLKAIAIAGGFTKYGSSSRVKVLRPKEGSGGYETIKVNIKEIMDGLSDSDIILQPQDTVVVFEGVF